MNQNRVALIILDGWGLYQDYAGNAITQANTPTWDKLWKEQSAAVLKADGESVGLPEGQMGTSEVNHFTIGAGRVLFQDLVRINKAINDESFFSNQALTAACNHVKTHNSTLHIMGLLSDGGVHSHQNHFYALLKLAKQHNVEKLVFHLFTDGRDTLPHNSLKYIQQLQDKIDQFEVGKIKSIVGRYYAMDRDNNWERTEKAFNLLTIGEGEVFDSTTQAIITSHKNEISDEFIEPAWIGSKAEGIISEQDAVIFANFRSDRTRQLTQKFLSDGPQDLCFVTMTQYHPSYKVLKAFQPIVVKNVLGEILSQHGVKQLRVTETEKFPHVTYFFNCKQEAPFEDEDRIMLDSNSDIKTHDQKPEMRAADIAKEIIQDIESGEHQIIIANICNGDMVGHTGNIPAAKKACEAVDQALAKIVQAANSQQVTLLITADHGNCETMIDQDTGEMLTSHTTNPVPLVLVSTTFEALNDEHGSLIDLAPTILDMLEIEIPDDMTGKSFIKPVEA